MLNTSRISPYLHFGQVSPRAVLRHAQGLRSPKFLRKLAWRDLSYWLLTKFPDMPSMPMRVHYQVIRSVQVNEAWLYPLETQWVTADPLEKEACIDKQTH